MKSINNTEFHSPLALSMGDPAGIGPEITALAWASLQGANKPFFLIGDFDLARHHAARQGQPEPVAIARADEATSVFATALPVMPLTLPATVKTGKPDTANAPVVIASIEMAAKLVMKGQAGAMVTNPIAKAVLYDAGFAHPGHTEFLGELARGADNWQAPHGPVMMLSGGGLRVALVSVHIPLKDVVGSLNTKTIIHTAMVLDQALKYDFGIVQPRIALCGLNPHAGEDGAMGDEEIHIINPAARALRAQGISITDAQPADALFREEARSTYDAVLALYHDQGLIPVKTLDFHGGINTSLGLPFIRTSPDHGTGFAIAGKGCARADSLIAAIKAAHSMSVCRASQVS